MKPGAYEAVVIDARPGLGGKLAAFLDFGGETVFERHLRLALRLGAGRITVLEEREGDLSRTLPDRLKAGIDFTVGAPAADGRLVLSTLEIYQENSPRVVWTLRGPDDVENARGELARAGVFPISNHTLRPLGKLVAQALYRHTKVTANHLTLLRIAAGLAGAALFFQGSRTSALFAGIYVLVSWFFDLTDGQLARLRSEISKFGSYLDSVGDGVVDNLYYLAIAASLWNQTLDDRWLFAGLAFLFGKYVFVNSTLLAPAAGAQPAADGTAPAAAPSARRQIVKTLFSKLDNTDVRIHFLALTAILGYPVIALLFHVVYFNLRWLLNLVNAYYKYEVRKG